MNDATAEFQSAIPFTILSPSPGLAALHAARACLINSSHPSPLQSTHCSKCGTFLLNGLGRVRVTKVTGNRVLQRTCPACGSHNNLPLERGNALLYPKRKRVRRGSQKMPVESPPQPSPATSAELPAPTPPATSVTPPRPKARPKKRSGLQDMLVRNREKEQREKREGQSAGAFGGLAAYLADL